VAHAGTDGEIPVFSPDAPEFLDVVDIDEMRRRRKPQRHRRNQALAAGEDAAVLRCVLGE
jgi:hypothetical protein